MVSWCCFEDGVPGLYPPSKGQPYSLAPIPSPVCPSVHIGQACCGNTAKDWLESL